MLWRNMFQFELCLFFPLFSLQKVFILFTLLFVFVLCACQLWLYDAVQSHCAQSTPYVRECSLIPSGAHWSDVTQSNVPLSRIGAHLPLVDCVTLTQFECMFSLQFSLQLLVLVHCTWDSSQWDQWAGWTSTGQFWPRPDVLLPPFPLLPLIQISCLLTFFVNCAHSIL